MRHNKSQGFVEIFLLIGSIFIALLLVYFVATKKHDAEANEQSPRTKHHIASSANLGEVKLVAGQTPAADMAPPPHTSESLLASSDKASSDKAARPSMPTKTTVGTNALAEALGLFAALMGLLFVAARWLLKKAKLTP